MEDRELLELAAKAAGIDAIWKRGMWRGYPHDGLWDRGTSIPTTWNPLTDDGDALRLAVRLNMDIDCGMFDDKSHAASRYSRKTFVSGDETDHGADPCAATRRAIVRAAAEIGKAMES